MGEVAINQMEIEKKIVIAAGDQLSNIAHIIPQLVARKMAARKYLESDRTDVDYKNYSELISYYNYEISKILGL